jgi:Flp pilus assembly protein CpaB
VSRRARAAGFAAAAIACAAMAAALAGGYRSDLESQLGPLRPVVVARGRLPARRALRPAEAGHLLEVRRIPERFAPQTALTAPEQAVGRAPAVPIPPGSYVLASELRDPGGRRPPASSRLGGGREPVEIAVTGAGALAAAGGDPAGGRVDVIVTTEPGPGGGRGRTYVAAQRVRLLSLARSGDGEAGGLPDATADSWNATLALTRSQALRLIQAENFARQVRLIPQR